MPLKVGDTAPDFEVMDQNKNKVSLSSLRGKRVVLLFYPMDFSPTCTGEHCSFGPAIDKIRAGTNTVVYGVSTDSPFAHEAYKNQYNIPYDLLADVNRKMVKAYDMYMGEEPFNCGKRGTVVIDEKGKIAFWQETPRGEHRTVEQVAAAARA
jgi:thioredoxin-dependent peroxiredoxin